MLEGKVLPVEKASIIRISKQEANSLTNEHSLKLDWLTLSVSKRRKGLVSGFKVRTYIRDVLYTFDNGKETIVATITKSVEDNTYSIEMKDKYLESKFKDFLNGTTPKQIWIKLSKVRKLVMQYHTGDERLLAEIRTTKGHYYTVSDRRVDIENLVRCGKALSFKLLHEKFTPPDYAVLADLIRGKFSNANTDLIFNIAKNRKIDPVSAYKEIALLLVKKSRVKDNVKLEAKRIVSRVRGDRIWTSRD